MRPGPIFAATRNPDWPRDDPRPGLLKFWNDLRWIRHRFGTEFWRQV
jgi:hypothetical protein